MHEYDLTMPFCTRCQQPFELRGDGAGRHGECSDCGQQLSGIGLNR